MQHLIEQLDSALRADTIEEGLSLGKADRAVLRAFSDGKSGSSKKLRSDGTALDGLWMGGKGIATWNKPRTLCTFQDLGSRAAQTVQTALKKLIPRKQIAESEVTEARGGRTLKTELRLKNGDTIPKGTAVTLKFEVGQERAFWVETPWKGPSGRDYIREPIKLAIQRGYKYVTGMRKPPSVSSLEKAYSRQGLVSTPTGHRVEVDGTGPDDSPAWTLVFGMT